jgi:CHASE2 domain-containing sensor protein
MVDFVDAAHAGNTKKLRDWVSGKAVLIGFDHRSSTPFSGVTGDTMDLEIQASTLRTILERRYLVQVPWLKSLSFLAIFTVSILTASRADIKLAIICFFVELSVVLIGTHLLFLAGWVLPIVSPTMALTSSFWVGSTYRAISAKRK